MWLHLNLELTLNSWSNLGLGMRALGCRGGEERGREVTRKYLGTLAEVLGDDGRRGGLPGQLSLVGHDTPPAHKGSSQEVAPPPRQTLHLPPCVLET